VIIQVILIGHLWTAGLVDNTSKAELEVLEQAETAFRQGIQARGSSEEQRHFQSAAESYEELRQRGAYNAALYRNQGNTYLLAGNLPAAILAYRRGLRLNPNDWPMRANLSYARDQVVYSSTDHFGRPPSDLWPPWLPRLTLKPTLWFLIGCYSLAWIGLVRSWMTQNVGPSWMAWLGLVGTVLFAIVLMIQVRNLREDVEHSVVVIAADKTYLLKGNHALYPRAYDSPLNRGVEARLMQVRGDWLQIQLTDGQIGWLPRQNALLDIR
jgi:tetratricopeptide (TPR) repeat protein